MTDSEMFEQYGVTPDSASRIVRNCKMMILEAIDEFVAPDCIDTGWREWLQDNDVDVPEGCNPSDLLPERSNEYMFMKVISDGTLYGGMTSARDACRLMRERACKYDNDPKTCKRVFHPRRSHASGPQFTCSRCGYGASDDRWSFCPKCGARYANTTSEARAEVSE